MAFSDSDDKPGAESGSGSGSESDSSAPIVTTPPVWPSGPWAVGSVRVRVPGSKSLTNRALVVAALARGRSVLTGALDSEDTRMMIRGLQALGIPVEHDPAAGRIVVEGQGGRVPAPRAELFLGNSGTSLRFLAAMAALGRGTYHLDGVPRMRQRPIAALIQALNGLGAIAKSDLDTGCPPVTVEASGLDGGYVFVRGDVSSQFLSGLLMALPYSRDVTTVEVAGELVSKPYVDMTIGLMREFGVEVENRRHRRFDVRPGTYVAREYAIEPDASAASYFLGIAAVTGGSITVEGLGGRVLQGDVGFADVLEHMGCRIARGPEGLTVSGPPPGSGGLRGVDVDMNGISDTVMTLAAVSLFAEGPTRVRGVGHIRHKETDRVSALVTELRKFGAEAAEFPDGLFAMPPVGGPRPARVATYDDHRMAMAFAVAATRVPGVVIENPGCVGKTYPAFWNDLERARRAAAGEAPATD